MPYNEYRTLGNDTIGALTDADQVALRQQELARALSRRAAPAGPERPKMSPLDFLLANALQQRAQPAAPSNGGLIVGPGRGQSDVDLANERAALSEARTAEEIARAKLMQTRQDIRENRPATPSIHAGDASYTGNMAPYPEDRPQPSAKDSLMNMIMGAFTGGKNPLGQAPATGSRARYDQLLSQPSTAPTSPDSRTRLRERAAEKYADEGDFETAETILSGGDLPSKPKQPTIPSATALTTLEAGLNDFGAADTAMFGWDPTDEDISRILKNAMAADEALALERNISVEEARKIVDMLIEDRLANSARALKGGWSVKLRNVLRNRGQMANPGTRTPATPGRTAQAEPWREPKPEKWFIDQQTADFPG